MQQRETRYRMPVEHRIENIVVGLEVVAEIPARNMAPARPTVQHQDSSTIYL